jgi:hypothetical protein
MHLTHNLKATEHACHQLSAFLLDSLTPKTFCLNIGYFLFLIDIKSQKIQFIICLKSIKEKLHLSY